jgi:hypothetical protein
MHAMKRHLLIAACMAATGAQAFPWYASGDQLRGGELLGAQERSAHVAKLQSMKTLDECKAYWQGHNQELERRALAAKITLPPVKGDPCEVMRGMGRIK